MRSQSVVGSWVQVEKRVKSVWGRRMEMNLHKCIMGVSAKVAFHPRLLVCRP